MRIYKAKDYADMSRKAANIVSAQVIMKPNCVLGLATGSTPIGLYKQLVEWFRKGDLDFSEVMTVNLDEYKGLSRENDQSYYYFMHQNLFDHVNIPVENTHLPNGMEPDSEKECRRYTELIQSLGGVDLQLLGIGHNGHIGFNEPGESFDKQVHCVNLTVNLDEYKGLSRENDQSYYYFMHQNLFDHVNIPVENTHLPNGMEPDSEKECRRYTELIQSLGGVDLQLLGIGHNGHIGFNEPGESFDKQVHCVNLTESTIEANKRFFASAEDVPKQAYTMGIKTIMQAKKILIVASGEDKAEIVQKAFFGPITPQVPASVLQLHNDVTLVADEAALSKLSE